jgi:hypothetical protein
MDTPRNPPPPDNDDDSGAAVGRASDEKMYTSEPLENDEGDEYVIGQQNVGPGNEFGGGEWPSPETPPTDEPRAPK